MTLNQIHYFVQIAHFENYRLAAQALHISQPSLSRSMALLEEELKTPLFEKKGRGVTLSKAGRIFLEQALSIEAACTKALQTMQEIACGGGVIDLGYVFPLAKDFIPKCLQTFLKDPQNEAISFRLHQKSTADLIQDIQQGKLDVGFGFFVEPNDLAKYPVLSLNVVAVLPLNHPLAKHQVLCVNELLQYPMIGYDSTSCMDRFLQDFYVSHQMYPHFLAQGPDEHTLCSLVRQNLGVALMLENDELKEDSLCVRPLKDGLDPFVVYLFWKEDREQLPAVERFLQTIQQMFSLKEEVKKSHA